MKVLDVPQSRESEEALLGSVLINPACMSEDHVSQLQPDDFRIVRHQHIWKAYQSVGSNLDIVSVTAELEKTKQLEYIGGVAYLTQLMSLVPSSLHADEYADRILDTSRRRRDIAIGEHLVNMAMNGEVDRASIIDRLARNEKVEGGSKPIHVYASELIDYVEERSKNPGDVWGIPTGFTDLDKFTGGLHLQQTLMLAAPPGVGKSILAMQIAKNVAQSGIPVAIYSFEMSAKRVLMRLLSADSHIPTRSMHTGRMDMWWDEFYQSVDKFQKLPIHIADLYGMTSLQMRADVARLQSQEGVKLIVIDYLNKLLDRDGGDDLANTKLKAQRVQSICREFNVSGIVIQSMNKEGMRSEKPHLAEMSGPADVHHEGDTVFLMLTNKGNEELVGLYPAKVRDGDTAKHMITLKWADGLPMFVNYTPPRIAEQVLPDYFQK